MTAPMLKRSIDNQFRKAMKRRRERQAAIATRAARRAKWHVFDVSLPETPENLSRWYLKWHRKWEEA